MKSKFVAFLIIVLLFSAILFLFFKRFSAVSNQINFSGTSAGVTTYPTWIPEQGVKRPTVTYEEFPFSPSDTFRKIQIIGCETDNSEWGLAYPKKEVVVPNVSAIATETMKVFLKEAALSGWGGFPSRNEVEYFSKKQQEVVLLDLTIDKSGTARVYFSDDVRAYGGGATRVACMHDSVELTLKQFPDIKNVVLCIGNVCADQKGSTIFQP